MGYILIADNMDEAIEAANAIASEHLEIVTENPFEVMTKVRNAGAIFIGEYSCEPLGDYFAGPNHVLPTNGTAKFLLPTYLWMILSRNPASFIIPGRHWKPIHKDIDTVCELQSS